MFAYGKKLKLPSAAEALPGRAQAIDPGPRHFVLGMPLQPPYPRDTQTIQFGLGCFWGAERKFWQAAGRACHGGRLFRRLHAKPHLR